MRTQPLSPGVGTWPFQRQQDEKGAGLQGQKIAVPGPTIVSPHPLSPTLSAYVLHPAFTAHGNFLFCWFPSVLSRGGMETSGPLFIPITPGSEHGLSSCRRLPALVSWGCWRNIALGRGSLCPRVPASSVSQQLLQGSRVPCAAGPGVNAC